MTPTKGGWKPNEEHAAITTFPRWRSSAATAPSTGSADFRDEHRDVADDDS
jgi:hypothetical protein